MEILTGAGYQVRPVPSGKLALTAVTMVKPDLILLDIMMPDMNGYAVCQALKENKDTKDIPIIFISAVSEINDKVKAFEAGGVDYIVKPVQPQEVIARVKTHLELRSLQLQLEDSNQKLQELDMQKNALLGMAAHDLRNPIAAIDSMAELLLYEHLMPEQVELIQDIRSASQFMLSLLNDLLSVSVLESGNLALNWQAIDVKEQLERIVNRHRLIAKRKEIQINLQLPDHLPAITVDVNKFEQILNNLLTNAIKFSESGTCVMVIAVLQEDYLEIKIQDQGQGIPAAEQVNLFKPFAQTSVKSTAGEVSTGLGLAITKGLILAHKGQIKLIVKSAVEQPFRCAYLSRICWVSLIWELLNPAADRLLKNSRSP